MVGACSRRVGNEKCIQIYSGSRTRIDSNLEVDVCFWHDSPHWARASSFMTFLDHTQRRTTVGKTPPGK